MKKYLDQYAVVSIPFPFTDRARLKKRPAVILSSQGEFNQKINHSVMAMITSAKNSPWPLDVRLSDLKKAGLPAPSVVRMKLFTIDHRLVFKQLGDLSSIDCRNVQRALQKLIPVIH